MNNKKTCPRCSCKKIYVIRRGKRRCAGCKYEWVPRHLPLHLDRKDWTSILRWFLHGLSSQAISYETGFHRQRILRALTLARIAMIYDIPEVFIGTIDIDKSYTGARWKIKRQKQRKTAPIKEGKTLKTPIFGIVCRDGKVWAELLPQVEARSLMPLLDRRVKRGTVICPETLKNYTGIAARGYVHRLSKLGGNGEYAVNQRIQIDGLEGFWGYLKLKLASKGGVRKERLPLYLAEYVWRYNNRNLTIKQKTDNLLNLLCNP
jgi:transposase